MHYQMVEGVRDVVRSRFEGLWKAGRREGRGRHVLFRNDGLLEIYEGGHEQGRRNGKGRIDFYERTGVFKGDENAENDEDSNKPFVKNQLKDAVKKKGSACSVDSGMESGKPSYISEMNRLFKTFHANQRKFKQMGYGDLKNDQGVYHRLKDRLLEEKKLGVVTTSATSMA